LLLHLPALICVYLFAVSEKITSTQYNLVKLHSGWVNVAGQNVWDMFFKLYDPSQACQTERSADKIAISERQVC
jgi:hypothetical protein